MRSARVLQFPLICRACDDPFYVNSGYDYKQDRICEGCAILKQALADKRAMVPHQPLSMRAVILMGFTAAVIIVAAFLGALFVQVMRGGQ